MSRVIDLSAAAACVDGADWPAPGVDWTRNTPWCAVPEEPRWPALIADFFGSAIVAAIIAGLAVIALAKGFGVYQ